MLDVLTEMSILNGIFLQGPWPLYLANIQFTKQMQTFFTPKVQWCKN